MSVPFHIEDETAMLAFGAQLAEVVRPGTTIFLRGDLGAGKTTLVRGFLRAKGFGGAVKSPTYTLVEPYMIGGQRIFHFDLYRLSEPEELEYMGIRDYFDGRSICFVEWPKRGAGVLPAADMEIDIQHSDSSRVLYLAGASLASPDAFGSTVI